MPPPSKNLKFVKQFQKLYKGASVYHKTFGIGEVLQIKSTGLVTVQFSQSEQLVVNPNYSFLLPIFE